jgi:hypothetical protein
VTDACLQSCFQLAYAPPSSAARAARLLRPSAAETLFVTFDPSLRPPLTAKRRSVDVAAEPFARENREKRLEHPFRRAFVSALGEADDIEIEVAVPGAVEARRHVDQRRACLFRDEPDEPVVGGVGGDDGRGRPRPEGASGAAYALRLLAAGFAAGSGLARSFMNASRSACSTRAL